MTSSLLQIIFLACDCALASLDSSVSRALIEVVTRLAKMGVFVYVMSSEKKSKLEGLFPDKEVGLSAEFGCFYRHPDFSNITVNLSNKRGIPGFSPVCKPASLPAETSENDVVVNSSRPNPAGEVACGSWVPLVSEAELSWKNRVMPIFKVYAKSISSSFLEERDATAVWRSTAKDPTHRSWQALELKKLITDATTNMFLTSFIENDVLVLKPTIIDRSKAITSILEDHGIVYNEKSIINDPNSYLLTQAHTIGDKRQGKQLDSPLSICDGNICILASDSRFEDHQFLSLFGKVMNVLGKSPSVGDTSRLNNTIILFVGGKKHKGSQYYLDSIEDLITLLKNISTHLTTKI